MTNSPCWQCADRVVGCHSKCKAYGMYQMEMEKERKNRAAEQKAYHTAYCGRVRRKAI